MASDFHVLERCLQTGYQNLIFDAMKTFVKMVAALLVITMSSWVNPPKASAQFSVSFQMFYDQLSPYGTWVSYPNYGYVWLPNTGPGFSPYATAGHWVFTEYGWTWVSDYNWGWAAFHYGRWLFDPYYGWLWVPDTVWGPAWVVWRSSPNYYGWAPLRPGISINVAFGPGYYVPNDWWVFAPCSYITRHDIYNYYAPRTNNVTIINNTTIINRTYVDESQHTTYSYGPDRDGVQKATRTTITPVAIKERSTPGGSVGNNGQLSIYKPRVSKTFTNGTSPSPRKVSELSQVPRKNDVPANSLAKDRNVKSENVNTEPLNMPSNQYPEKQRETKPAYHDYQQPQREIQRQPKENNRPPKEGNMTQMNSGYTRSPQMIQQTSPSKTVAAPQKAVVQNNRTASMQKSSGQIAADGRKQQQTNVQQIRQQAPVSTSARKPANNMQRRK